jgi:hypothetical protein
MPVFQARCIEPDATALYIEKDPIIWHERLGHIGEKALRELPEAAIECEFNKSPGKTDNCEICIKAKITTNISREPIIQATIFLELIYSDIYGPIIPQTREGNRYIVIFIDSIIKWIEISLLKTKNEVFSEFKIFLKRK